MRSQSSLLMASIALAGSVAACLVVRGDAACCGAIVGTSMVFARAACSDSDFIKGMGSSRARGATAGLGDVLGGAKTCAMRSHSSLLMASVALAGSVAACLVVRGDAACCGAIVGTSMVSARTACSDSDFIKGLASTRSSEGIVGVSETLEQHACSIVSHAREADCLALAVAIANISEVLATRAPRSKV